MPARDSSNVSHVSQTDHRVIRSHSSAPQGIRTPAQLELPDSAQEMPHWERDRAWSLGNWSYLDLNSIDPGPNVTNRLLDVSKSGPADGAVLDTLGLMALRYQRYRVARPYFERSLRLPDAAFSALNNLLNLTYQNSDFEIALDYANQILKIDPQSSRVLTLKADILANLGRRAEAIRVGEQALQLNPSLEPLRVWLIVQLEQAGRNLKQKEHEQILHRLRTPTLPPSARGRSPARQTSEPE
jgi:tetratricopeptide (TPR) repeat protein